MKLYKFRPLANIEDFNRAKQIIETGHFWCSQFTELNDPMEGVFTVQASSGVNKVIKEIFNQKLRYKFCSFASGEAFNNPLLWGYYANGFKGMVIEIIVKDEVAERGKINYIAKIQQLNKLLKNNRVKTILKTKLLIWQYEEEYRFLTESENNYHKIGEIKTIHFGEPYSKIKNRDQILENSISLREYEQRKSQLIDIAISRGIWVSSVEIRDCKVKEIYQENTLFPPVSEAEFRERLDLRENKEWL